MTFGAALTGLLYILSVGRALYAAKAAVPPMTAAYTSDAHGDTRTHVLVALVVILGATQIFGAVFRASGQPAVIGEIVAGIVLGPSLLGRAFPTVERLVFPQEVKPLLSTVAELGVLVFMFLVGLELDTALLKKKSYVAYTISHASIVAPMLLGTALALWLYPELSPAGVPFTVFALFLGVAMSITAFPVLARILTDRSLQKTEVGVLALGCAAIDDASAWCLLALVVGVAQASPGRALLTVGLMLGFVTVMFLLVSPLVRSATLRDKRLADGSPRTATAAALGGLLMSALITDQIGIHAIFGAFIAGAIIPQQSELAHVLRVRLEDFALVLLLPAFFALTGLRMQIGLVTGWHSWLVCGALIMVACVGKFGGAYGAARIVGIAPREAASLGILMNTRGLMELVVLNVGVELGIVSPTLFTMMVIMALTTTLAASPAIAWLQRKPHDLLPEAKVLRSAERHHDGPEVCGPSAVFLSSVTMDEREP
ncbi:MAG: Sodium/hydrogen exchanger [Myxococcaceae bacterium]|nr:Sodium/hydrogen exchanger [Myxococcaceae bacterium]